MKPYSAANLLAKEYTNYSTSETFLERLIEFKNIWIDSRTTEIEITVTIPHSIYLRTRLICDYIESVYSIQMPIENFLSILYEDFIHRSMKKHNPMKILEELTKHSHKTSTLVINDPMQNKIHTLKRQNATEIIFGFNISKKQVKRGEIILAELDEVLTNAYFTVEQLISRLWLNYISDFSEGNNEKAVDKLIKLAAKHF